MKVEIYSDFGGLSLIFYEEFNGKRRIVEPIKMILKEYDEDMPCEPSLRLSPFVSQELLQSFADQIEARGIKPSKKPVLENELQATKYHLEDMRRLVFKKLEEQPHVETSHDKAE